MRFSLFMTATQDTTLPHKITAASLAPGHVIQHANYSPVTVTEVWPSARRGFVTVHGFNSRDATPRVMFAMLSAKAPVTVTMPVR